ncbi:MAG: CSLREA domain-containing protein [Chloroflexi bacterium]|nr:CSLREA domain-containing protein [Chloroflexota bacterium]MCI0648207.1 CSLREA domain-containing protein [Chloroflexota bacterium]MCI0730146.1 CSLREA domain-containing protein [Chloroflexota bacterium]
MGTAIVGAMAAWLLGLPMPAGADVAAPASFAIVNVTTTADEYDSVPNGDCSLREAIQSQNDNANFGGCVRGIVPGPGGTDTILLPSGAYTLSRIGAEDDLNLTGDLDLRGSVVISATQGTAANVVGATDWNDRLLHVLSGTVTLKGLAVSGGDVGGGGGGMRIEAGATASVSGSSFTNNSAFRGGGLYNGSGVLTLVNSTVSFNETQEVFGNGGGGIYNDSGVLTLINSTVSYNETHPDAIGLGGGIANQEGTLALIGASLYGNAAHGASGGAIEVFGGTVTLTNTTVTGNAADDVGGGLHSVDGTVTLTNVTFSDNSALSGGGGIYSFGSGSLTLVNTIVADSQLSENCGPAPFTFTGGFNLSSDGSCDFGAGRDNVDVLLGPLADNGGSTLTHLPLPGSPAIDGGTNTGCPDTDQRGQARPQGAACDVGAVEVETSPLLLFVPLVLR